MRKLNHRYDHGIASYMMIIFLAAIATFIIAILQSRLLLAIYRQRSLSDMLISTYNAESEIYDILNRIIVYHLPLPPNQTFTLSDGSTLKVTTNTDPATNAETISVTADRQFAVSKIEAIREVTAYNSGPDRVEMILALDCTGSMNGRSCSDHSNPVCANSRMLAEKKAAVDFVTAIKDLPQHDQVHLGLTVFGVQTQWVKDTNGLDLTPTNDQQRILNAINAGFALPPGNNQSSSPVCSLLTGPGGTNIGGGYIFSHEYFAANATSPGTKRIEIVVTDGNPNSRIKYPECPKSGACSYRNETQCMPFSKDFLRCALAKIDTEWGADQEACSVACPPTFTAAECSAACPGLMWGRRDPSIDAYGVTVNSDVTSDVVNIFTKYAGPENENYFRTENANDLSQILLTIFGKIKTSASFITIRRVIPN